MAQSHQEFLDGRVAGRLKREAHYLTRLEKREAKAERQIGQLMRDGKIVYYVMPVGGKYREGKQHELVDFLIRNNYA